MEQSSGVERAVVREAPMARDARDGRRAVARREVHKQATFPFFRSVKARMVERYIFNYRIRPDELAKKLPAPWLEPQVVNGWSAVSFCILWLDRLTVSPIPPVVPFSTISCAYRIGVIDTSAKEPEPSVYITDRWADLSLIPRLAPWILLDTIPSIKAAIGHEREGKSHVQMSYLDGTHLFSAEVNKRADRFESEVFDSVDHFAAFIKGGVSSYAPSIYEGSFSKVDLRKEDAKYDPLEAEVEYSELSQLWQDAGMEYDSAIRATGSTYEWTYRGLWRA